MIKKREILFYVLSGVLILFSFLSAILFAAVSQRSTLESLKNEITFTGPIKAEINLSNGSYEIYYPGVLFQNISDSDITDLYINLINISDNEVIHLKSADSEAGQQEKTSWRFDIKDSALYTLDIGYLKDTGPDIDITIRSVNNESLSVIGLFVAFIFLVLGVVIVIVTVIKSRKDDQKSMT